MAEEHSITGESSWHFDNYKLKATDTQKERRNFEGYGKKQYMNLGDLQKGDQGVHMDEQMYGKGGMTETDEDTSGQTDGPYTRIQEKTKGNKSKWPTKSSAEGKRYNTEKPTGFGRI